MVSKLETLDRLRKEFIDADKDNSGYLDLAELKAIVSGNLEISDEIGSTIMNSIDANNDGVVSYLEFLNAMSQDDSNDR